MRPLYQECILPNIAYIGGPAEVAYWLQLKAVFDHFQINFPVLMPRNFALVINKSNSRKVEKLELNIESLFSPFHELKRLFIEKNGNGSMLLESEKQAIVDVFKAIKDKATEVDKSLEGFVGSEEAKF